jgi:hypothetical protein
MGRFARNQDEAAQKNRAPEIRLDEIRSEADRPKDRQAKGMKYFWIVLVSLVGLSAGWMMGRAWLEPPEVALTESAALADDSTERLRPSGDKANQARSADTNAQAIEQDSQSLSEDQSSLSNDQSFDANSEQYDRKHGKARRAFVRSPRATARGAAMGGPVRMMLKPFKAINPLKLRKLRLW